MDAIKGYESIDDGEFIRIEDAFKVAVERLLHEDDQTKGEFVDWFFSGNFVAVRG